jgi:hypothetical protein
MISNKYQRQRLFRNRHHLKPKSRGGSGLENNLLLMDMRRHNMWHQLFDNLTLDEVIELLIRVRRAKKNQSLYIKK